MGMLALPLCIAAIFFAFYSVMWSWILIAAAIAVLVFALRSVSGVEWNDMPELSPSANEMFKKYGHFYTMQHGASIFSSLTSGVQFSAIIVGVINAYYSFWFGLLLAVFLWPMLNKMAKKFNPTRFITDPFESLDHREVMMLMAEKNMEQYYKANPDVKRHFNH